MGLTICDPDGAVRDIPGFPYSIGSAVGWTPPPETYWTYDALMGKSDDGSSPEYHDLICMEDASIPASWRTGARSLFSHKGGVTYRNLIAGLRSATYHPYNDSRTEYHNYTSFNLDVYLPCDRASYWVSTPPIAPANVCIEEANFKVRIFNSITVNTYLDWTTNDGVARQIHCFSDSVGWPGAINYYRTFYRVQARDNTVRVRVNISGNNGGSYFRVVVFTGGPDA